MIQKIAFRIIVLITLISCKQKEETIITMDSDLEELFALMQGSFNSEKQSLTDSTYYNISLHMYPIWKDKGHYLYVEQALNNMQDKPYRQRVYEVVRADENSIASHVYTIPNDSLWIGKWKTPESFDQLKKEDLELRNGCEVILMRKANNHFSGKTVEKTCESTLRGAAYATSEVDIWSNKIVS